MISDPGLIDYDACYRIQREFVARRRRGEIEDSLIITEHPAVFTIGRSGSAANLLVSPERLKEAGIKLAFVDRGGDITFHGPGQMVLYPIIDLKARGRDLHQYMRDLEGAAIGLLGSYSIRGERVPGRTGVWASGKKLVSIGIAASDWVTYHGVSVNVNTDLSFFKMINPCGFKDAEAGSIQEALGEVIDMAKAKARAAAIFKKAFGIEQDEYSYAGSGAVMA